MRISKYIARSGICSRRKAGELIKQSLVKVDGHLVQDQSFQVLTGQKVEIEGQDAVKQPQSIELWKYYKPPGCLVTRNDPLNRPTVFEMLPPRMQHMISVGRLDYNSEGLLLLTNNGDLAHFLASPKHHIERRYLVKAFGSINPNRILNVQGKHKIGRVTYRVKEVAIESRYKNEWVLSFTLEEGKNRELRNIIKNLDLKVQKLKRIGYGDFGIGKLPKGCIKKVDHDLLQGYLRLMNESDNDI